MRASLAAILALAGCDSLLGLHTFSHDARGPGDGGAPDGVAPHDVGGSDGLVHLDAETPDFVIEAENYSRVGGNLSHQWTLYTDNLASAGQAVRVTPLDMMECSDPAMVTPCAVQLQFDVIVTVPAVYYVHARFGPSHLSNSNGVWYGLDGTLDDYMVSNVDTYAWANGGISHMLGAGTHTLYLWHRDPGVVVDVVALTRSPVPPS